MNRSSPSSKNSQESDVKVYSSSFFELNLEIQDAVREFILHDIDDIEGLENKRIQMHNAFTNLYEEITRFGQDVMAESFDMAFLRKGIAQAEPEVKEQMQAALEDLVEQEKSQLGEIWMIKVLAWLHQSAASSSPFVEESNQESKQKALTLMADIYTMLEKPFSAVPSKVDGTQKLRRVALSDKAHSLQMKAKGGENGTSHLIVNTKISKAEFYDEFLNELIGNESTFRQAFNPFDELLWRDLLSSFIFEESTELYNEVIPLLKDLDDEEEHELEKLTDWKKNTAGLSEVYCAMIYNDIADAQMRNGNLEDASKLYMTSSEAFGRAEKAFKEVPKLHDNAQQSEKDKKHRKAQALFCRAENSVKTLSDLLTIDNRKGAIKLLEDIFKDLQKAEKLSKRRELTAAIQENLRTFSFAEDMLGKQEKNLKNIAEHIKFAKDLRKTGLIQNVNKHLDEASAQMRNKPADALEEIREGLSILGILLNLEAEDKEVRHLRNKTLAFLAHIKYLIQFKLSSQLEGGLKFIQSRILENLHAEEAASYYKIIGEQDTAAELMDRGRLAFATAYASEAQIYSKQSEQLSFKTQLDRINLSGELDEEVAELKEERILQKGVKSHDVTLNRIECAKAAFEAAANELDSVKNSRIREKNNVDMQVRQLRGVVMKLNGDLARIQGAKDDFMAEVSSKLGDEREAKRLYSDASDKLRNAVGDYSDAVQVFREIGDNQAAQNVEGRAKIADLLARGVWDNKQRIGRDQEPNYKGQDELIALYQGLPRS